jgi:hypothetical protein
VLQELVGVGRHGHAIGGFDVDGLERREQRVFARFPLLERREAVIDEQARMRFARTDRELDTETRRVVADVGVREARRSVASFRWSTGGGAGAMRRPEVTTTGVP